jgi:uncharacterized RDD family membrane protein YckC
MTCPDCGEDIRDGARFCMNCGNMVGPAATVAVNVMPGRWTAAHGDRPARKPDLSDRYLGTAARVPRFIAWLIDQAIVGLAAFVYVGIFGIELISADDPFFRGQASSPDINWAPFVPIWLAQGAYFVIFPATPWMGTPGKRMLTLRVTDASGDRINIFQSAWRYWWQSLILYVILPFATVVLLAVLPVGLGLIVVPAALIAVLATKNEQSPWDMLAGTRVLE